MGVPYVPSPGTHDRIAYQARPKHRQCNKRDMRRTRRCTRSPRCPQEGASQSPRVCLSVAHLEFRNLPVGRQPLLVASSEDWWCTQSSITRWSMRELSDVDKKTAAPQGCDTHVHTAPLAMQSPARGLVEPTKPSPVSNLSIRTFERMFHHAKKKLGRLVVVQAGSNMERLR